MNVTLSLPDPLIREARHRAVDRGISLSRYLSDLLAEHLSKSSAYEEARQRHLAAVASGEYDGAMKRMMADIDNAIDRGTNGKITWTRDELHER